MRIYCCLFETQSDTIVLSFDETSTHFDDLLCEIATVLQAKPGGRLYYQGKHRFVRIQDMQQEDTVVYVPLQDLDLENMEPDAYTNIQVRDDHVRHDGISATSTCTALHSQHGQASGPPRTSVGVVEEDDRGHPKEHESILSAISSDQENKDNIDDARPKLTLRTMEPGKVYISCPAPHCIRIWEIPHEWQDKVKHKNQLVDPTATFPIGWRYALCWNEMKQHCASDHGDIIQVQTHPAMVVPADQTIRTTTRKRPFPNHGLETKRGYRHDSW